MRPYCQWSICTYRISHHFLRSHRKEGWYLQSKERLAAGSLRIIWWQLCNSQSIISGITGIHKFLFGRTLWIQMTGIAPGPCLEEVAAWFGSVHWHHWAARVRDQRRVKSHGPGSGRRLWGVSLLKPRRWVGFRQLEGGRGAVCCLLEQRFSWHQTCYHKDTFQSARGWTWTPL